MSGFLIERIRELLLNEQQGPLSAFLVLNLKSVLHALTHS
jgi:hypothetical protein